MQKKVDPEKSIGESVVLTTYFFNIVNRLYLHNRRW